MSSSFSQQFEFLLFSGFSNMVLANALEPLRDVKLRANGAELSWQISTLDGAPVTSSSGIQITPDGVFDPTRKGRRLVIVSGYRMREQTGPGLSSALRVASRNAAQVIAVDTGAWLLASAGLLDGQSATIHWQELDAFEESFPKVEVSQARFVRSGRYVTCGGASTTLDMTLDQIQSLFGSAAAFDASTMFVYDPERQTDIQRGADKLRETGSPKLLQAINVMTENIETPLTTFELADKVSMSERTLNRTFQRELGMTPGRYYKLFRLQRARHLALETQQTVEQIALRCGFSSASSLGRSFAAEFGATFRDIRKGRA